MSVIFKMGLGVAHIISKVRARAAAVFAAFPIMQEQDHEAYLSDKACSVVDVKWDEAQGYMVDLYVEDEDEHVWVPIMVMQISETTVEHLSQYIQGPRFIYSTLLQDQSGISWMPFERTSKATLADLVDHSVPHVRHF
jgi:hypothetical protein